MKIKSNMIPEQKTAIEKISQIMAEFELIIENNIVIPKPPKK